MPVKIRAKRWLCRRIGHSPVTERQGTATGSVADFTWCRRCGHLLSLVDIPAHV